MDEETTLLSLLPRFSSRAYYYYRTKKTEDRSRYRKQTDDAGKNKMDVCRVEPDRQWRSSSFQESKKVRVSDLDLDLEHTLDVDSPGVHRVQVWSRSGHLSARKSNLRKSLQTDGQTDDGRLAIALAHSWNELIKLHEMRRFPPLPPHQLSCSHICHSCITYGAVVKILQESVELVSILTAWWCSDECSGRDVVPCTFTLYSAAAADERVDADRQRGTVCCKQSM